MFPEYFNLCCTGKEVRNKVSTGEEPKTQNRRLNGECHILWNLGWGGISLSPVQQGHTSFPIVCKSSSPVAPLVGITPKESKSA
jgi:hypothetical protein